MFCKILFCCILIGSPLLLAQSDSKLTARELFYAPPAKQQPVKADHPVSRSSRKQTRRVPPRHSVPDLVETASTSSTSSTAPAMYTDTKLVQVAFAPDEAVPLGVRYSLLRLASGNSYDEVDADTIFHSGDRIRLRVEPNDNAYLYIVMRGSSGSWRVLFPSAEIDDGNNRVRRGHGYDMPPGGRFTFDETPGEERLFLVLSRQPEESLENLIYNLSAKPAAAPQQPARQPKRVMLASAANISDDLVANLRDKVYARDLVFEKVDDKAAGETKEKEKAVYVVNPSRDPDARLVVDVKLHHR
ncbi:MAG: DUF4384 domain-containing protein [Bryobacterales bacterium]|nr:DUF4384 domain-containing protein [Bryobacterales bacterium]